MKLWMKNVSAIVVLCLLISTASFGAEGQVRNLVLNRPYEYYPMPNYHQPYPTTDDGDITQLTDGYTRYPAGGTWVYKSSVVWQPGRDVPVIILFDLGAEATVSEVRVNTCGGGGAGVTQPGLKVYVSLDNKEFILAGESPASQPPRPRVRKGMLKVAKLSDYRARYVAIEAKPLSGYTFILADEIEIMGKIPADKGSSLPILSAIQASGAKGFQRVLAGAVRGSKLFDNLTGPVKVHSAAWPKLLAQAQIKEMADLRKKVVAESGRYEEFRAELTDKHRVRALKVYKDDTVVWEVLPDADFTMLSLPQTLPVKAETSIDMVINAMGCTALGVANLTENAKDLKIEVISPKNAPAVTPRVGRFTITTNARYIADTLLATDSPQTIPSGESKVVWLIAESADVKAGLYNYEVRIKVGAKKYQVPLKVEVHNITLSKEIPLSTGNWSDLSGSPKRRATEILIRDEMLKGRITMGAGTAILPLKDKDGKVIRPVKHDTERLQNFIELHKDFQEIMFFYPFDQSATRPHKKWFGPVEWMDDEFKEIFRELITGIVKQIKESGRDYDGFYFQMFDETMSDKVAQLSELVHSFEPKVQMMVTIPQATKAATKHFVDAGINVYANHATQLEHDNAPDGYETLRSDGRQLWIYGATGGSGKERDPLNYFCYMHWTAYYHKATGVWFWDMVNPNGGSNGWIDEKIGQSFHPMVYTTFNYGWRSGQGFPADVKTAEQVIPSRRWIYVRMGIEDYMLLKMAQQNIDKMGTKGKAYQKQLDEIVTSVVANRYNRKLFHSKRKQLVKLVETLVK